MSFLSAIPKIQYPLFGLPFSNRSPKAFCPVFMFPRQIDIRPAEMAVRRGLPVNGPAQIQIPDNRCRPEVKYFLHSFRNGFIIR